MRQMWQNRKEGYRRGAVALALAAVLALSGCGAQGASLSGQDADSLSVTPAVDEVLETAENGKLYDYLLEEETEQSGQYKEAVVSPQQAANIAGMLFENAYGLNQTGKVISLQYFVVEDIQPRWCAMSEGWQEDGVSYAECTIEAQTGDLLLCIYRPTLEEQSIYMEKHQPFVIKTPCAEGGYRLSTDFDDPSYAAYLQQEIDRIRVFLTQAGLDKKSPVASIVPSTDEDGKPNSAPYYVTYEDGRTATVDIMNGCLNKVVDWGEYPGKEFWYDAVEFGFQFD